MSKKPRISKQKAISEIIKGLRKGFTVENIFASICTNFQLTERTFYNYLDEAKQKHTQEQQEAERVAHEQLVQAKKEELKSDIITIQERKDFLTKIITSKTELIQFGKQNPLEVVTLDNGSQQIITNDIRLKALQELNRMDGSYSPEKFEDVTDRRPLHEIFKFDDDKE